MLRTRTSVPIAVGLLMLACGGESRVAPENETCMGPAPSGAAPDYAAAGMPSAEPDLQAWVALEQHGMTRVTTNPCEPNPSTRMLLILSEARDASGGAGRRSHAGCRDTGRGRLAGGDSVSRSLIRRRDATARAPAKGSLPVPARPPAALRPERAAPRARPDLARSRSPRDGPRRPRLPLGRPLRRRSPRPAVAAAARRAPAR
jgi:hypothetical protein